MKQHIPNNKSVPDHESLRLARVELDRLHNSYSRDPVPVIDRHLGTPHIENNHWQYFSHVSTSKWGATVSDVTRRESLESETTTAPYIAADDTPTSKHHGNIYNYTRWAHAEVQSYG